MALTGTDRALTTARAASARCAATRAGFTPTATQGTTPGSDGGLYIWRRVAFPTTTWTPRTR